MSTLKTTQIAHPSSVSNNIVLNSDGSATIADLTATTIQGTIQSGTAVASTSGTAIDFTGIPSWVKRVTVMFDGVSGDGASDLLIQLGDSGGIETTGYKGSGSAMSDVVGTTSYTAGIGTPWGGVATKIVQGLISLSNITGNTWVAGGVLSRSDITASILISGSKTLSDVLTQVRITHVNGTDTFDAGSINILMEG
jgi:hypothetical protein